MKVSEKVMFLLSSQFFANFDKVVFKLEQANLITYSFSAVTGCFSKKRLFFLLP